MNRLLASLAFAVALTGCGEKQSAKPAAVKPAAAAAAAPVAGDVKAGKTLAPDEAVVIEFKNYDGFWMFTNMGAFWNSMDYIYRNVSFTPARASVDDDGHVRLVMTHKDPGYHNWLETQEFDEGYLAFRNVGSRSFPTLSTRTVKVRDLAAQLPHARKVTAGERVAQLKQRFDGIRRRYRI